MTSRERTVFAATLSAAILPWALVVLVNTTMGSPTEAYHPERCTRACHDRGAPHAPLLPESLAGEGGLVDRTVVGLHRLGASSGLGYGGVNLAVFVVVWPLSMLYLFAKAVAQRLEIRERRRGDGDA